MSTGLSSSQTSFLGKIEKQSVELKRVFDLWGKLFYEGRRDSNVDYDEAVIKSADLWLRNPPTDKPWLLLLPLIFPHCPFAVEEPYFSLYDRESLPEPSEARNKTGYEPQYFDYVRKVFQLENVSKEVWKEVTAVYYGMISHVDAQLGRILWLVDVSDTYTLFFTDHGEYLGDHGLIEKWTSGVSDSLVHEPLIISGPQISKGVIVDALTEIVDIGSKILELSGVKINYETNRKSMVPLLKSKVSHLRNFVISEGGFLLSEESIIEYPTSFPYVLKGKNQHEHTEAVGRVIALRDENYTFVYRLYEKGELYSRKNDPQELHNLIDSSSHSNLVAKYEKVLLRFLLESSDHAPLTMDGRFPTVSIPSPKEQYNLRVSGN